MINIDLERLKAKAIDEAVSGNYDNAISINQQILEIEPSDVDSLMQLAHAYWQTGSMYNAKKYYRQTLTLEPNNSLAKKRLQLLSSIDSKLNTFNPQNRKATKIVQISDLIEEPGKTKIVKLNNIGKPEHLGLLKIGEQAFMKIRKRRLEVRDVEGNFLGCLPDDISKRLIDFMNQKGIYEAYVFSIDRNEVKIFIREIKKPLKYMHTSSFSHEDSELNIHEEEDAHEIAEEPAIDLDSEKILLTPDEQVQKNQDEEEEEEDKDEDKDAYPEYEE